MMLPEKVVITMNIASFRGARRCVVSADGSGAERGEDSKGRRVCFWWAADDNNEEWDGFLRETEGGRVQGRAVVSRFIGQGCGGCREAQMGRTLPLRNRNAQTLAHTQRHTHA